MTRFVNSNLYAVLSYDLAIWPNIITDNPDECAMISQIGWKSLIIIRSTHTLYVYCERH